MSAIADFHFIRPYWLLAAVPVLALAWMLARGGPVRGSWARVCDAALLPYLLVGPRSTSARRPVWTAAACGLVVVVALAGPAWQRLPAAVFRDQSALVLILDLSRSMNATDVNPSRLERARFKLADILRLRRAGQVALVVFAAQAFAVTPLTEDAATVQAQIPALRTDLMPSPGSEPQLAVAKAVDLLRQAGAAAGDIVLLTDGITPSQARAALAVAGGPAVRLSVLGMGTPDGAPIPDDDGGFVRDAQGNIVVEPLREDELRALAGAGGGLYQRVRSDDADVRALTGFVDDQTAHRAAVESGLVVARWREVGPWLLLVILPVVALVFRRGLLCAGAAVLLAGSVPPPATAGWWLTSDQEGLRRFEAQDYAGAARRFTDPAWRGAAHYRDGDYSQAVEELRRVDTPEARYNLGNALARLGRNDEAMAAYDEVLAEVPDHADARYNKTLLEKLRESPPDKKPRTRDPNENATRPPSEDKRKQPTGEGDPESDDHGTPDPTHEPPRSDGTDEGSATAGNHGAEQELRSGQPADTGDEADRPEDAAARSRDGDENHPAERHPATPETADAETGNESEPGKPHKDAAQAMNETGTESEDEQATEQWLRRIPDDPGGLLRRKFQYQYERQRPPRERGGTTW